VNGNNNFQIQPEDFFKIQQQQLNLAMKNLQLQQLALKHKTTEKNLQKINFGKLLSKIAVCFM